MTSLPKADNSMGPGATKPDPLPIPVGAFDPRPGSPRIVPATTRGTIAHDPPIAGPPKDVIPMNGPQRRRSSFICCGGPRGSTHRVNSAELRGLVGPTGLPSTGSHPLNPGVPGKPGTGVIGGHIIGMGSGPMGYNPNDPYASGLGGWLLNSCCCVDPMNTRQHEMTMHGQSLPPGFGSVYRGIGGGLLGSGMGGGLFGRNENVQYNSRHSGYGTPPPSGNSYGSPPGHGAGSG